MPAELNVQPCPGSHAFGLHEPLDGGAVLEEAGCSTGIARVSRGGELHAACIGAQGRSGNPWRE